MAATGATGIAGGNYQIFERFIVESGANVYLDTPVGFFLIITLKPGLTIKRLLGTGRDPSDFGFGFMECQEQSRRDKL